MEILVNLEGSDLRTFGDAENPKSVQFGGWSNEAGMGHPVQVWA